MAAVETYLLCQYHIALGVIFIFTFKSLMCMHGLNIKLLKKKDSGRRIKRKEKGKAGGKMKKKKREIDITGIRGIEL